MLPFVLLSLALQSPAPPTFEAASAKRSAESSDSRSSIHVDPSGFTATRYRLKFLIPWAYNVAVYQVAGPDWLEQNTYDIAGRAPAGASNEQIRQMVQALIAERFGMRFHREQRESDGYALVVGKDGPKLQIEHRSPTEGDGRVGAGPGRLSGKMISSSVLAQTLSLFLGCPVLDQTGIDGLFNFSLQWKPDETERRVGPNSPPAQDQGDLPSLFAAIQEQLGLKLIGQRTKVEMLVIDHIEQTPAEN